MIGNLGLILKINSRRITYTGGPLTLVAIARLGHGVFRVLGLLSFHYFINLLHDESFKSEKSNVISPRVREKYIV